MANPGDKMKEKAIVPPKTFKATLLVDFPVAEEDYAGDVVLIRDFGSDKPFSISPGDSLTIGLSAHPYGSGHPRVEVDLKIDFREPFCSDNIELTCVRANVKYVLVTTKENAEK